MRMGLLARLGFVACGLLFIGLGVVQVRYGPFVFDNASYHQPTFAVGAIGLGGILILLAFLPPREWAYRHLTTKKRLLPRHKKLG